MNHPVHKAKVHTEAARQKRTASIRRAHLSPTPKMKANNERIRALNPMSNPEHRETCSRRLRAMNHQPSVRGGNGRGLTRPQQILLDALGESWVAEFALSLVRKTPGYPTHYKLDLALPERRVAIEVDGNSHHSRKHLDVKKDEKLRSLGWLVLRFWNQEILDWNDTGRTMESSISTILAQHDIHHSR